VPMLTVFHKGADGVIRLSWASELLFLPTEPGQDPRHVGTVEPMWTLLDLTPGGGPTRTSKSNTNAVGPKRQRVLSEHTATSKARSCLRTVALPTPAQSCQGLKRVDSSGVHPCCETQESGTGCARRLWRQGGLRDSGRAAGLLRSSPAAR
jgi:hypothetical protein